MASRFISSGWITLKSFRYMFRTQDGNAAPTEIDVNQPIQTVVDTSRDAQRGVGQLVIQMPDFVHGVASAQRQVLTLQTILAGLSPPISPLQVDVWLTSAWCNIDNATVSQWNRAMIAIVHDTRPPNVAGSDEAMMVRGWDGALDSIVVGEPRAGLEMTGGVNNSLPFLVRPRTANAGFAGLSLSNGAVDFVRIWLELWITPRGGTPPGMA